MMSLNEVKEFNGIRIGDTMKLSKFGDIEIVTFNKSNNKFPDIIFKDKDNKEHTLSYREFVKASIDSLTK